MTTITVTLEQSSLVPELKALVASMKGVLLVSVNEDNVPNKITRKVIDDARRGKI